MTTERASAEGRRSRWQGHGQQHRAAGQSPALPERSRRARSRLKAVAGLGVALGFAFLALLGLATPASAHNSLIGSTPTDGSNMESGPNQIELKFDQPVQMGQGLNSIAVIGPNNDHWEGGPAQVDSNVVTAPVRPLGPAGSYKIGWRILSADGHPVSGELTFTLTKAGNGTPAPAGQQAAPGNPGSSDSGGGVPVWVWIAGAGVLLAAGLVLALRMGGKAPQ
jgi:copper resistance protein C